MSTPETEDNRMTTDFQAHVLRKLEALTEQGQRAEARHAEMKTDVAVMKGDLKRVSKSILDDNVLGELSSRIQAVEADNSNVQIKITALEKEQSEAKGRMFNFFISICVTAIAAVFSVAVNWFKK